MGTPLRRKSAIFSDENAVCRLLSSWFEYQHNPISDERIRRSISPTETSSEDIKILLPTPNFLRVFIIAGSLYGKERLSFSNWS